MGRVRSWILGKNPYCHGIVIPYCILNYTLHTQINIVTAPSVKNKFSKININQPTSIFTVNGNHHRKPQLSLMQGISWVKMFLANLDFPPLLNFCHLTLPGPLECIDYIPHFVVYKFVASILNWWINIVFIFRKMAYTNPPLRKWKHQFFVSRADLRHLFLDYLYNTYNCGHRANASVCKIAGIFFEVLS